jgi:hypothetical protein
MIMVLGFGQARINIGRIYVIPRAFHCRLAVIVRTIVESRKTTKHLLNSSGPALLH